MTALPHASLKESEWFHPQGVSSIWGLIAKNLGEQRKGVRVPKQEALVRCFHHFRASLTLHQVNRLVLPFVDTRSAAKEDTLSARRQDSSMRLPQK